MSPTSTQLSFAFFLLVTAPCFGACRVVARGGGLRSFAVGAGWAWIGLAASGLLAALLFPRYPRVSPPEHTASLFLIPAHLVGLAALLVTRRRGVEATAAAGGERAARRPGGCALALLGLLSLFPPAAHLLFESPLQRALPWSARDVHVSSYSWGFPFDFTYCLKARVAPDDVAGYVERLDLEPYSATRRYDEPPTWAAPFAPDDEDVTWWDPPSISAEAWVLQVGGGHTVVAYRDGWLYAGAFVH